MTDEVKVEAPAAGPAPRVFDTTAQYRAKVLSGGVKACVVRWPADAEWCEYSRAQRTIRTALGRGKAKTTTSGEGAAAVALLAKIRVDLDGAAFDADEALDAIDQLEYGEVTAVTREAEQVRVVLRVWGVDTVHLLRMPTARERRRHEDASTERISGHRNTMEIRAYLEPSGLLYDALLQTVTGYAGAVPVVHKAVVVGEVLREIQIAIEEARSPE